MEKYGVLKEIQIGNNIIAVPLNATEEEIIKIAEKNGIEMEKVSGWKEITDGGQESRFIRSV